jgi:hypothetical protein
MSCIEDSEKIRGGVGPWLWKEVKKKEEKGKSELCGRHSD